MGRGEAYDMKCQVYWMYMYSFVFRLMGLYILYLGERGVEGGGGSGLYM